jgi:hypothetical protein
VRPRVYYTGTQGEARTIVTFEDYARARLGMLLRLARGITLDAALAEDLVQELLIKVHRRWSYISRLETPDLYIRRMLINEYISWRRKWARIQPAATIALIDTEPCPNCPASPSTSIHGQNWSTTTGKARLDLTVSLDLPAEWPRPQCRAGQPNCRVLPVGTIVTWQTVQEPKEPKIAGQMWTANGSRPNGFAVTATEYTSAVPKIGPVTRALPPFTVDELKAIVSSSSWQSSVTAETAQQDEQLFTPKPDTTRTATPRSTDNPTFGPKGQSYAPPRMS